MTVSFHKYTGEFFPGTGKLDDNGGGLGKHFALNVPLQDGIDDESYLAVFKTVIEDTVNAFRPTSIVLQCGADSLGCDRLGAFNLSIAAHGECVDFVQKFGVPLLVLGGGGYTIHNVSRCWAYETSVLVGADVPNELPHTPYDAYFAPDYKLHAPIVGKVDNQNTPASLQKITIAIRNKLRYLQGAPSVQMQEYPPDLANWLEGRELNDDEKDDARGTGQAGETRIDPHRSMNDYFESEADQDKTVAKETTTPRGSTRSRRARATRARATTSTRGRSSRAAAVQAAAANKDIDEPSEEEPEVETPKRGRAKPGRKPKRARGRPPTKAGKDTPPETSSTPNGMAQTPIIIQEANFPAQTDMDMAVDENGNPYDNLPQGCRTQ